jgi:hypothetical protein
MNLLTFFRISVFAFLLLHQEIVVESFTPSRFDRTSKTSMSVSISTNSASEMPEDNHPNRRAEFIGLEPIEESSIRQERMKKDQEIDRQFVKYGDDLWTLRNVMNRLSRKLIDTINSGLRQEEEEVREQLRGIEEQDPELVYKMEVQELHQAQNEGRNSDAELHGSKAMEARSCLPAYNLEGLWVGKYGHHGYEMIVRAFEFKVAFRQILNSVLFLTL